MAYTEERAYYVSLLGLAADPTNMSLSQLQAAASVSSSDRVLNPSFDNGGKFVADYVDFVTSNQLSVGEETVPRHSATISANLSSSQALRLTYFTARKTETISQIRTITGSTAAGATPTLCRLGLYKVEANGDITLVASTANDTAIFAAANTAYSKSLTTPYLKVAGQRYAVGILVVTAAATPSFISAGPLTSAVSGTSSPMLCSSNGSNADLPATVTLANQAPSGTGPIYAELLP